MLFIASYYMSLRMKEVRCMDDLTQGYIGAFLAQYDTLAIATEDEGQPYVTRVFYAEGPIEEHGLVLYGTFITHRPVN